MQMTSKSVLCPVCSASGTVTLIEDRDPLRTSEGHRITFSCSAKHHELSDVDLLKLWVAARTTSSQAAG